MFIGRREYLSDLETLWRKRTSSIVVCRGRRRIGKSTLIREFARRTADAYIEIEGLPPSDVAPVTNRDELDHFVTVLNDQTGCGFRTCERWYDAFSLLEKQIDDAKRTVVLLDEISWMGQCDPQFPGILRSACPSPLRLCFGMDQGQYSEQHRFHGTVLARLCARRTLPCGVR